ncbi:MAG TPA: phosphoribosylamine--glycine ligase [Thermomicrobiaceae bacterium]|nr:phosphoribosylamine--glycine ligase [Thermomicrobiaceae bacterium]
MRLLIVGGGAREHALAWKLAQSPEVDELLVAPGNAGTAAIARNLPIAATDIDALVEVAGRERVGLTVVGPEEPLARGLADRLRARGLLVFGPDAAAARIESSKSWAKDVMRAAGVPTAAAREFSALEPALDWVADAPLPLVVKANGLAAGKGVVVAATRGEAERAVRAMLAERSFGEAGSEILIEECLSGPEVSVLALTDGETIYPLVPATDYKRAGAGDTGPNTGGMGAFAPVPAVTPELAACIRAEILEPTLSELRERGIAYRGVLYAGLMLTESGPRVIEFNCRFGDPETEVVLPLLADDLLPLLLAAAEGRLADVPPPRRHDGACVGVVLASAGYPGSYTTGCPISGLDDLPQGVLAFHAGTAWLDGRIVTSGGRVLTLVARGTNLAEARQCVYEGIARVSYTGKQFRPDIAEPRTL